MGEGPTRIRLVFDGTWAWDKGKRLGWPLKFGIRSLARGYGTGHIREARLECRAALPTTLQVNLAVRHWAA